ASSVAPGGSLGAASTLGSRVRSGRRSAFGFRLGPGLRGRASLLEILVDVLDLLDRVDLRPDADQRLTREVGIAAVTAALLRRLVLAQVGQPASQPLLELVHIPSPSLQRRYWHGTRSTHGRCCRCGCQ